MLLTFKRFAVQENIDKILAIVSTSLVKFSTKLVKVRTEKLAESLEDFWNLQDNSYPMFHSNKLWGYRSKYVG